MNKVRLLALIYSPEDQKRMLSWLAEQQESFEIVEWSGTLEVPIQSAVTHYSCTSGIDGLLIDDHQAYDEFVTNQLEEILRTARLTLYSATNAAASVIGAKERAPSQPLAQPQQKLLQSNLPASAVFSAPAIKIAV